MVWWFSQSTGHRKIFGMASLSENLACFFLPELHTDNSKDLSYTQGSGLNLNLLLK
jgi:hypothetical protein